MSGEYIFQKIRKSGLRKSQIPGDVDARQWYRKRAQRVIRVSDRRFFKDTHRLESDIEVGGMYMFFYDPKLKDELPYYDRFPLIFPIDGYNNGFLGINMHYLPPMHRAILMDSLYSLKSNNKKLRISYDILKSASKHRYFKPCVKRYLFGHVKSRFYQVPYEEWDMALMLPTERFKRGSGKFALSNKQAVWKNSKGQI